MATLEKARASMQERLEALEAEADSLRTALGQLEDEQTATTFGELLRFMGSNAPTGGGPTATGRVKDKLCPVPGCENPGPYNNLGRHTASKHA